MYHAQTTLADHRYRFETGGCPIEVALDVLSGRWKGLLLYLICVRPVRFHELRKRVPHVSQRMLVRQLRELERDGLILRAVAAQAPRRVSYSPTPAAVALTPLLVDLRDWAARHMMGMAESVLTEHDRHTLCGLPFPGARFQPRSGTLMARARVQGQSPRRAIL